MKKFSFFLIIISLLAIWIGSNCFVSDQKKKDAVLFAKKRQEIEEKIINDIKSKYNTYVKTNADTILFKSNGNVLEEYGLLGKGNELELEQQEIVSDSPFFKIKNSDFYVSYNNLDIINELSFSSDRYKNYLPFDENIVTKNPTIFEDENGVKVTINQSLSLPIIIKYDDKYGVEYNNKLYFVSNDSVDKIEKNDTVGFDSASKVRTLTYHFLYDPSMESCTQDLCVTLNTLETHFKYLNDNNYFTLTLNELEMFIDGRINVPKKSIVLTVDDGTIFNSKVVDLLEKYKVNITLFAITSWSWDAMDLEDKSIYLDVESHTDNMHITSECPGYGNQGGAILCKDKDYILNDLKKSREVLKGSVYFAYPFYDYNDRAIELLKEAGFHMAFAGDQGTGGYSYRNTNKFLVPRKAVYYNCNANTFANLVAV